MNGDNADFCAVGAVGGTAHPSGYPLYVMWLRAWSWLPGTPAHAAAVATILLAVAAVLVLHAACRAWGARPLAASIACALFATSPIVMRIHTEADVFPLNCLVCAAVVWLAAAEGPLRGTRRAAVLGLVAGLGIAHNLTCVLVAPIGLYGVVRGARESSAKAYALAVLGLVVGLLPYAYLLVAPETPVSWGKVDGLTELWHHVLRRDYGSFKLSPKGDELFVAENLTQLASSMGRAYLWLPALAGLGALGYSIARPDKDTRVGWIALAASLVLAGPVLAAGFNKRPVELGLWLTQRFHIQSVMLLAIPVAVALTLAGERVREQRWKRLGPLAAMAAFLGGAALSLPFVARVHSVAIERSLTNLLTTLPPAAIVIGTTDELHFGTGYLQTVLAVRPDVQLISLGQVGLPFYRDRIARRSGIVIERPSADEKLSVTIAEQALATGRPVFIDPYQANIAQAFSTYPYGLVFRVVPRGATPPTVEQVFELNKQLYARYQFDYAFPGPGDQLATQIHRNYARAWTMIAQGLEAAGRGQERDEALGIAAELAPR
ncbi:MAG: DUF2723 domain-containing protein [Myxococcales bacterium]|nr:DUF2723 domain-containing protein [Myxococcales bacterium]